MYEYKANALFLQRVIPFQQSMNQMMQYFILFLLLFSMHSAGRSLQSWQQIEISWQAAGKKTVSQAVLLRPESFLRQQHIQIGIDRASGIAVNSIKPWHGAIPAGQPFITGIFKYWSNRVETFTFISQGGRRFQLHATGTHPIYVDSLHRYVKLDDISPEMVLRNDQNEVVHIQCPDSVSQHCGRADNNHKLKAVYDLEVNGTHAYFAGHLPVHNFCAPSLTVIVSRFLVHDQLKQKIGNIGHALDKVYTTKRIDELLGQNMDPLKAPVDFLTDYNSSIYVISSLFPPRQRTSFIDSFTLSIHEQLTGKNLIHERIRQTQQWMDQGIDLKMNGEIFITCDFSRRTGDVQTLNDSMTRIYAIRGIGSKYLTSREFSNIKTVTPGNNCLPSIFQLILKKIINHSLSSIGADTPMQLVNFISPIEDLCARLSL